MMVNMKNKVAYLGVFLAFALILGYVESLIPFAFGIPGMKLGLPNLAVLLCLYLFGKREAFLVNVMRIVLSAFLFTNMYALLYSLAGAVFSFAVLCALYNSKHFSPIGVSIAGAAAHNLGQIVIAILMTSTFGIAFYLPPLLLCGIVTGAMIGMVCMLVKPGLTKIMKQNIRRL